MKRLCGAVALASLVFVAGSWAETEFGTAAIVVSVDANAKTITLKHTDTNGVWKQTVATWDDKTEWGRAEKAVWDEKPATAALAGELKKDSKVYVMVRDLGGSKFRLNKLKTIPPDFEVK
jgi:hypothetical protein